MPSAITSMAFVRLTAPDLGRMEAFLTDFGMTTAHRDAHRLYMRGCGDSPYLHVTELGPPGAISCAYTVADESVLQSFVRSGDAAGIESLDGPGGGKRVRLRDVDGCWVELVCGRQAVQAVPPRPLVRGPDGISRMVGPARVVRISHTARMAPDARASMAWYQRKLGVIPTDELYIESRDRLMGQFDRLNLGDTPVDHHVIFIFNGPSTGLHHVSYAVEAPDDIFFGYDHLEKRGYDHVRGIGRHALGSQIFDYWMSPFNSMHEHWSSAEKMIETSGMNYVRIGEGMAHDTGGKPPERFTRQATPYVEWPRE